MLLTRLNDLLFKSIIAMLHTGAVTLNAAHAGTLYTL